MTQKLDRRTRYTRSVIKQSFLELLQKYPFPKVTVTAICKKAEITRATWYAPLLLARIAAGSRTLQLNTAAQQQQTQRGDL